MKQIKSLIKQKTRPSPPGLMCEVFPVINLNIMYPKMDKDKNTVRICKSGVCIEAKGRNGELLVAGVFLLFVCLGIAAIAGSNK
jgi:hypothetical protein